MNVDWLLGFIEGEGSFVIAIQRWSNKETNQIGGFTVSCRFTIGQSNKKVLDKIQTFLLTQNIDSIVYKIPKSEYQYHLRINSLENNLKLIKILSKLEWNTNKYHKFKRFEQACLLIKNKQYKTKAGLSKILELRIKPYATKGRPLKVYSLADFGIN